MERYVKEHRHVPVITKFIAMQEHSLDNDDTVLWHMYRRLVDNGICYMVKDSKRDRQYWLPGKRL